MSVIFEAAGAIEKIGLSQKQTFVQKKFFFKESDCGMTFLSVIFYNFENNGPPKSLATIGSSPKPTQRNVRSSKCSL